MPVTFNKPKEWADKTQEFKELVLYICQKCASDPKFDTLKLNKLLFLADFWAYGVHGQPITGWTYQKLEKGPAPSRMAQIRKEMVASHELGLQELSLKRWQKPVNLRSPDLSKLKSYEVALVDALIDKLREADGGDLSDYTHSTPCWLLPNLHATIPYETVFLANEPLTAIDVERGLKVAQEFNLLAGNA